jgi:hypothetical protein
MTAQDRTEILAKQTAEAIADELALGFHVVCAKTGSPLRDATEAEVSAYMMTNAEVVPWQRNGVAVANDDQEYPLVLVETNYRNHPRYGQPQDQGNWAWL